MSTKIRCALCGAKLGMEGEPWGKVIECAKCGRLFQYQLKPDVGSDLAATDTIPMKIQPAVSSFPETSPEVVKSASPADQSPVERTPQVSSVPEQNEAQRHGQPRSESAKIKRMGISHRALPSPAEKPGASAGRRKIVVIASSAAFVLIAVSLIVLLSPGDSRQKMSPQEKATRSVAASNDRKETPPPSTQAGPAKNADTESIGTADADNEAFQRDLNLSKQTQETDPAQAHGALVKYTVEYPEGKNFAIALREIESLEQRRIDFFAPQFMNDGVSLNDPNQERAFSTAIQIYRNGDYKSAAQRLEKIAGNAPLIPRIAILTVIKYICLRGAADLINIHRWVDAEDIIRIGLPLWKNDEHMKDFVARAYREEMESLKIKGKPEEAAQIGDRIIMILSRYGTVPPDLEAAVRELRVGVGVVVVQPPENRQPSGPILMPIPAPNAAPSPAPQPQARPQPATAPVIPAPRRPSIGDSYISKIENEIGWKEEKTDHFRVLINSGRQEQTEEIKLLLEGIYSTFIRIFAPKTEFATPVTVIVHKSVDDLHSHGGISYISLPPQQRPNLIVGYIGEEIGLMGLNRLTALHFFDLAFNSGQPAKESAPPWFRDGIADSFATSVIDKGSFSFNSLKTPMSLSYLYMVSWERNDISIVDIMNYDSIQFDRLSSITRPAAWAFCYFLWHQQGTDKSKKEYEGAIDRFVEALRDGKPRKETYDHAFPGTDYHVMERDFQQYIRRLGRKDIRQYAQTFHIDYLKKEGNWKEKETKSYRILTNSFNESVLPTMGEKMELMFQSYKNAFKPAKAIEQKAIVIVHGSRSDYEAHGGPPGSAAYYNPVSRVLVGYMESDWNTVLNYFFHEGTHQFFDLAFPDAFGDDPATGKERIPIWFTEGIADCFGASRLVGDKVYFNALSSPVGRDRLQRAKRAIGQIPLHDLLNYDKDRFYGVAGEAYPLAWSFCYFLWNWPDTSGAGDNNGQMKKVIVKLVEAFKNGKSKEDAYKEAFGKLKIEDLEKEWVKYIREINFQ